MLLQKIWERYFFKEALKTALLFLFCFWGLYMLIDYAHHSSLFRIATGGFDWKIFTIYYASEFINKSELLVPLAILLGTIRVLCKLNEDSELVALMASGVSAKAVLAPFILLGLIATGLMYLKGEYLQPLAANQLAHIADSKIKYKENNTPILEAQQIALEDHSILLFQKYDINRDLFLDVYWIESTDRLYRIQELSLNKIPPRGYFIDTFERDVDGTLLHVDYHSELLLPKIRFNEQSLKEAQITAEALPLSELWARLPPNQKASSEKEARLITTFHQKLVFPWLCLLAVIVPAPFCMIFTRRFPVFVVYAGSIFGFMAIYIVMNAAHVLGRRQLIDPLLAIWIPFLVFAVPAFWRIIRR